MARVAMAREATTAKVAMTTSSLLPIIRHALSVGADDPGHYFVDLGDGAQQKG